MLYTQADLLRTVNYYLFFLFTSIDRKEVKQLKCERTDIKPLHHFRFWCQKVLPLVYDDSLSYYEVLCKVVTYINNLITTSNEIIEYVDDLKKELETVQEWIDNFDTSFAESIIREYLATMIFVEISDSGYFIYYIPESWDDIKFNTTGLDIALNDYDYGHLVLSY